MPRNWFSSDWHLSHKNIITYDKRPFKNIEEHDKYILDSYLDLVDEEDNFYFLGDLGFNVQVAEAFLKRMVGHKFFIKGNRDKSDIVKLYRKYGEYLGELKEIIVEGQKVTICHYPLRSWNKSHRGALHIYGHEHGSAPDWGKSIDVAVNVWDYFPVEFGQIKKILDTREIKYLGHHTQKD